MCKRIKNTKNEKTNVLRVGGRLKHSKLIYNQLYPILLPRSHRLTELIIRDQHLKSFHAGTQATLSTIKSTYWIIDGKNWVKNVIRKCITCC